MSPGPSGTWGTLSAEPRVTQLTKRLRNALQGSIRHLRRAAAFRATRVLRRSARQALLANIVPTEQPRSAVLILSAVLLTCGLIAVWTIRYRPSEADRARGNAADRPSVLVQLRDGFDYARHDRRVATVLVLVAFHCGLTMASTR